MFHYDPEKPTILEGFGVSMEDRARYVGENFHGSRADILSRICNSETLPLNVKFMLLVELGCHLVTDTIEEMSEALTQKGA